MGVFWSTKFKSQPVFFKGSNRILEIEFDPFASGGCRSAHMAWDVADENQKFVVKRPLPNFKNYDVFTDLSTYERAEKFINAFQIYNKTNKLSIMTDSKKLSLKKLLKVRFFYPYDEEIKEEVLLEEFLKGVFIKFNSNTGWSRDDFGLSPSALSHFSWVFSYGQELLCDLQGVKLDNDYKFTDPAIHSVQRKYGGTDLGSEGIMLFFLTHKCNSLCSRWPRIKVKKIENLIMADISLDNNVISERTTIKDSFKSLLTEEMKNLINDFMIKNINNLSHGSKWKIFREKYGHIYRTIDKDLPVIIDRSQSFSSNSDLELTFDEDLLELEEKKTD